ncbi:hydrogenase maturation protease [Streptomyces sp. HUAS TT3]|uniref:hydrogenase maturation protease n=1 Tax=Streptomyces sp. HUAS TT3 TaxID=3447510 RepID=UPI003F658110
MTLDDPGAHRHLPVWPEDLHGHPEGRATGSPPHGTPGTRRRRAGRRRVELASSGGDPGRLIGMWQGATLGIVVDAAHARPGCPGRVHRLEVTQGELAASAAASSHGMGLGEAVELARVLGWLPQRLIVFAVEGEGASVGRGLSAPVQAAVASVADRVRREILRHRGALKGLSA